MRRIEFLCGAAALGMLGWSRGALAQSAGRLPGIQAEALDGHALRLPADLPGPRTLVIVTTKQEHTEGCVAWAERMGGHAAIPMLDLALFDDYGAMFRGLVFSKMKDGIPDSTSRARLAIVFGGKAEHLKALAIKPEDQVVALVVERATGLVVATEYGKPTDVTARRIGAALRG